MIISMKCQVVVSFALAVLASATFDQLDITLRNVKFSPMTKNSVIDLTGIKIRKFNRTTQIFMGVFKVLVDFDNEILVSGGLFKKQGNEYRLTPFRIPPSPYCEYWSNENFMSDGLINHTQLPPKTSCPAMPKGTYTLRDFSVDGLQIPQFLEGEYRVSIKYQHQNRLVNEILCDLDIQRFG